MAQVVDKFGRPIRDLRISVTDKCNFRSTYCMPKEIFVDDYVFLSEEQLLSCDEVTRLGHIFASLGVRKLRITGGERLLGKTLQDLIDGLANRARVEEKCLTT